MFDAVGVAGGEVAALADQFDFVVDEADAPPAGLRVGPDQRVDVVGGDGAVGERRGGVGVASQAGGGRSGPVLGPGPPAVPDLGQLGGEGGEAGLLVDQFDQRAMTCASDRVDISTSARPSSEASNAANSTIPTSNI